MTTSVWHNEVCGELPPQAVLHFFEEICGIPHGSFHTEQISDYLVRFARDRGLRYEQDQAGNVVIFKDASLSRSDSEPLILQGHMDMVLEKTDGCTLDMEKDPIRLKRDGDILYAEGTTLGADDGIAVAMMLALLDDDAIEHPPLECVITVNEEVGMLGAKDLSVASLRGRRMINIDSETEGIFTVGCAGGTMQHAVFPTRRRTRFGTPFRIAVSGLTGGHSGVCIGEGRANADLLLGRVLYDLYEQYPFRLISIEGGLRDNAIPRSAQALLLFVSEPDREKIEEALEQSIRPVRGEYAQTDPEMTWETAWIENGELAADTMSKSDTKRILRFLMLVPNGLLETDGTDHSILQTSLNLGILESNKESTTAVIFIRSSINSQRDAVARKVALLTEVLGGTPETGGVTPAWERVRNSPLCVRLTEIYERQYGKAPGIEIIHGGVECSIFADKLPGLDCVSIGPTMTGIHTPDEKLSISSVQRVWDFLLEAVKEL